MAHDFSLHSGERQTAPRYDEIRADHRARYEWADARLPPGGIGADIFCGVGYGTKLLARTRHLVGIDGSADAIAHARRHYADPQCSFICAPWPFTERYSLIDLNFMVSLESIEHVGDGPAFFKMLADGVKPGGRLIFSTPNADALRASDFSFHHRHYTLAQSLGLAEANGLEVIEWAGQDVYRMRDGLPIGTLDEAAMGLRDSHPGQFLIFAYEKR